MGECFVMMGDPVFGDYVRAALELAGIPVARSLASSSVICCAEDWLPSDVGDRGVVVLYRRPRYTRSPAYLALSEACPCRAVERPFLLDDLTRAVGELMAGVKPSVEIPDSPEEETAVILNRQTMTLEDGTLTLHLTEREMGLLEILCEKPGAVVSREMILRDGWNGLESRGNAVDVYVGYLRRKLEPFFGKGVILSVRGAGYSFEPKGKRLWIR